MFVQMDAYIHQMEKGKERASANQPDLEPVYVHSDEECMRVFRRHTLF